MPTGSAPDQRGPILFLVFLVLVGLLVLAWGVGREDANGLAARFSRRMIRSGRSSPRTPSAPVPAVP